MTDPFGRVDTDHVIAEQRREIERLRAALEGALSLASDYCDMCPESPRCAALDEYRAVLEQEPTK